MKITTKTFPPCFLARPINGGDLARAPAKHGLWYYEPKVNGWRTLVHVPSGAMFNRHGERLSIAHEFKPALDELYTLWIDNGCDGRTLTVPDWLDCEALERRHNIGRGTLVVLDMPESPLTYRERWQGIREWLPCLTRIADCEDNSVYCLPHTDNCGAGEPGSPLLRAWQELQADNEDNGVEFYEGLVAKRADSLYPFQLRNSKEEFPGWMKHRWAF